ncbi:conserved hypothetical protein [Photobacterium leiognathi lrivu.4.1]|uniref:Neutral/alkaline non-lysosomal ceramidase N-terminal domain-containing protein n=2 Tax=Photobacterium leiognathi TaxID=553611 RepID=V5F951_PHOLE|nr:conserved hypothetical protein [Photobacterium leiognathi lrivu.4.1]
MANNDTQFSLIVFDTTGVGDALINDIRQRVSMLTNKVDVDNLVIAATHTHAGLDYQGIWGGIGSEYRNRIVDIAARAIIQAQSTAQGVKIFAAQTQVPVSNRRGWGIVDDSITTLFFDNRKTDSNTC